MRTKRCRADRGVEGFIGAAAVAVPIWLVIHTKGFSDDA